eukprot:CAMPEP_0117481540 /NCGR_PEP_ID=MMETSP0784-20121206/12952_1 /TAXON_ID=39447 /ORGANISM="" /LENGTH=262 /DNA_ID=CAMNT_0005275999 /DNA_START=361 /DNA_END=1146 /DNA_ORIENTATION=-
MNAFVEAIATVDRDWIAEKRHHWPSAEEANDAFVVFHKPATVARKDAPRDERRIGREPVDPIRAPRPRAASAQSALTSVCVQQRIWDMSIMDRRRTFAVVREAAITRGHEPMHDAVDETPGAQRHTCQAAAWSASNVDRHVGGFASSWCNVDGPVGGSASSSCTLAASVLALHSTRQTCRQPSGKRAPRTSGSSSSQRRRSTANQNLSSTLADRQKLHTEVAAAIARNGKCSSTVVTTSACRVHVSHWDFVHDSSAPAAPSP